jgi:hypothetical protein
VGTYFTKLILFVHKVFFVINTLFVPLLETLFVGRRKLFFEGWKFFTTFMFQPFALCKKAFTKYTLQFTKNWKQKVAKSGLQGGLELHSSSCMAEISFPRVNFFNSRTYHSESTAAALFDSPTNNIFCTDPEEACHDFSLRGPNPAIFLSHPPNSPDIVPYDLHLFGPLKDALRRCRFAVDDELKHSERDKLRSFSKNITRPAYSV